MPTKSEVTRTNAECFAQILRELLPDHPTVKDIYFDPHVPVWCIQYQNGDDDEADSFNDVYNTLYNL